MSAVHQAQASTAAPGIAPTAQSIGPRAPIAATPPRAVWARPVVARTAPPAPPVPFADQQRLIAANGGRPVAMRDMAERLPPVQAARLAPPVRVLSAPAAKQPPAAAASPAARYGQQGNVRADRPPGAM